MFKKILAIGLLVSMSAQTFAADFSDVESSDKNAEAIYSLQSEGVLEGYSDGSFKPDQSLNRAELLKIAMVAAGFDPDAKVYKNCFKDVKEEWFARYVCFAKERGFISGYEDGYFRPEQFVNKVESLKMILESFDVVFVYSPETYFEDVPSNAWFAKYVTTADYYMILEEYDWYQPGRNITRAGASENLYRVMENEEKRYRRAQEEMACEAYLDKGYPLDTDWKNIEPIMKAKMDEQALATDEDAYNAIIARNIDYFFALDLEGFCRDLRGYGVVDSLVEVSVLPKTSWEFGFENDLTGENYSLDGDILTLNVGYGGCGSSDFTLFWDGGTKLGLVRSYGVPVPDFQCEMYISETLKFDLSPIKDAYWESFSIPEIDGIIEVYGGGNQTKSFSIDYPMV